MRRILKISLLSFLVLLGANTEDGLAQTGTSATTTNLAVTTGGVAGRRSVQLIATTSAGNAPVSSGQVVFAINGKELAPVQVVGLHPSPGHETGTACRSLLLPSGTYTFRARFVGTSTWASSGSQGWSLTVPPLGAATLAIAQSGDSISYTLTARDTLSGLQAALSLENIGLGTELAKASLSPKLNLQDSWSYLGFAPSAMITADLSGTGNADLVATDAVHGTVSIFSQRSDGTWPTVTQTIDVGADPSVIAAMDLDGDGLMDLVVVDSGSSQISIILQDRAHPGSFLSSMNVTVGSIPAALAIGDFNSDGLPDVAVANFADNSVSLLLNNQNAPGQFRNGPTLATQSGPSAIVLADLTGSGNLDMAITSYYNGTLSVFAGSPRSTDLFTAPKYVNYVGAGPTSIIASDLNGDGLTDLVVCNLLDGTLSVLPANAQMPRQFPEQYIIDGFNQPASVAILEPSTSPLPPDLLVADDATGALTVLHNSGKGAFTTRSVFSLGSGLSSVASIYRDPTGSFQVATLDPGLKVVHVITESWAADGEFDATVSDKSLTERVQAFYSPDKQISDQSTSNILTLSGQQQESQTIEFAALGPVKYGAAPIVLQARATSGLPVSFTIVKGPAVLTAAGSLTATGVGEVIVRAGQPGNATFSAATPVDRTFLISPGDLLIKPQPAERAQGSLNPAFTGVVSGLVGTDEVKVRYLSAAIAETPAGIYAAKPLAISPEVLWTAALRNYTVHASLATLTICRPPSLKDVLATQPSNAAPNASSALGSSAPICAPSGKAPALPIGPATPNPNPSGGLTAPVSPLPLPAPKKPTEDPGLIPIGLPVSVPVGPAYPAPVAPVAPSRPTPSVPVLLPVPSPRSPVSLPLPTLPSISLGLPSIKFGTPIPRGGRSSSLLVLEDRRVPTLFGGVTLSITLSCPAGVHSPRTLLLADGSSEIASVKVRPGEEYRVRVPLLDAPRALVAYYTGSTACPSATSKVVELMPAYRAVIPVQELPDLGLVSGPGDPPDDTLEDAPSETWHDQELNLQNPAYVDLFSTFLTHSDAMAPGSCMQELRRLPIETVCSTVALPAAPIVLIFSSSPTCGSALLWSSAPF